MSKEHLKLVVSNKLSESKDYEEVDSPSEEISVHRLIKGLVGTILYLSWLASLLGSLALLPIELGLAPIPEGFTKEQVGLLMFGLLFFLYIGFLTKGKHPGVTDHGF